MNREIFRYYKVFRTTDLVEKDIKMLRKLNNLIDKYTNTGNDRYQFEAQNILKTASNYMNFDDSLLDIIKDKMIQDENHPIFDAFARESL